jgi:tripartite-type tricarboxylate transporter receptor subunit TctC
MIATADTISTTHSAAMARASRLSRWAAACAMAMTIASGGAAADEFPTHPIRLLVGFSAGGGLDISCRHWAQRLSARIGQPVIVENRPGASGELAVKQAMASKPDGYTLVCLSGSNTISSAKPNAPFDIRTDVAPVIQMTHFTFVLYVNPALPVKSFAELVAYAKARPGQLNYGSVGTGSTPHLAFEFLKLHTGMDVVHVPFKGTAQTATAVIAGDIQIGLDAIAAVKPISIRVACDRSPWFPPGARRRCRTSPAWRKRAWRVWTSAASRAWPHGRKRRGPSSTC